MTKKNKTVVLGVTGSIAAYKGADLCSKLVQVGYDVQVIMTAAAQKLVGPQTFFTLSRNPVMLDLWTMPEWKPGHVDLADRAELLVVAPCTANFIGKLANGIGDDALSTFALAFEGPVLIAPGMNPKMWANAAVRENVGRLQARGVKFIGPAAGRVACGDDIRPGRMEEVSAIIGMIENILA